MSNNEESHTGDGGCIRVPDGGTHGGTPLTQEESNFLDALRGEGDERSENHACRRCKDRGFTINIAGEAEQCPCARDKMYAAEYEKAGIPPVHFHKTFNTHWNMHEDAFGDTLGAAARIAKGSVQTFLTAYMAALPDVVNRIPFKLKYANRRESVMSLVLVGGTGSGKSLAASIVGQSAIRRGISVKYYDFLEVVSLLREYGNPTEKDEMTAEWAASDLIILDGLTAEYTASDKGPFKTQFDRLAKVRANLDKPVLITAAVDYQFLETGSAWKSLIRTLHAIDLPSRLPHDR